MNRVGHVAFAFWLVIVHLFISSAVVWAQVPAPPTPPRDSAEVLPPLSQSPMTTPFSPLFGPYSAPPTAQPVPPEPGIVPRPFMLKGGRATAPTVQTERLVVTPSIIVDEAYTDNVFLDNDFKRSDFITSFTPGLLLGFRTPDFGLGLGYVFTSEIYVNETQLNDAMARWGASLTTYYNLTPQLKLDFEGAYFEDNNTTASGIAGVSTGRTRSRGATASPAVTWQFDPVTTLQIRALWYMQSFDQVQFSNTPVDSYNTYSVTPTLSRKITPTLTGTFQYQYLFSDVDNGQNVAYHLLLPGVIYQARPDLSLLLAAGPQITTEGQTGTTLAAQVGITKNFSWGAFGLTYSRREDPLGGLGGSAETNTVGLSATLTNLLLRGLTLSVLPYYTNSVGNEAFGTTNSITLQVLATYPVTRWMVAFLAYNYFRQRDHGHRRQQRRRQSCDGRHPALRSPAAPLEPEAGRMLGPAASWCRPGALEQLRRHDEYVAGLQL